MAEPTTTQTIESLDLSLAKVFNDFYVVPSFQREYVWEDIQVEQLLQDVYDAFSEDGTTSEYFIGSLVVCPGPSDVLVLIDGQQRMTTTYLFLCAVRDYLTEKGAGSIDVLKSQIAATDIDDLGQNVFRYRVHLQYDDSCGVLEQIAQGVKNIDGLPRTTRSVTNMINAYQTIRTFLETECKDDPARLPKFYAYFTRRVKLVRIKTQSVTHALKVFETINDRGVGLDSMDLLKNLMFMRANAADFEKLKDRWKDLVDRLYRAGEKPLRFLRYFIFANYDVDRLREEEIYAWFVKNEKLCGYSINPLAFVDTLRAAAEAYTRFIHGQNADGTPNRYLTNIGFLSGAARQHLILLLAGRHLAPAEFMELCRQLENLFFAYIITREPTKEFEQRFARWAPELRKAKDRTELDSFIKLYFDPAKDALKARYGLAFQQLDEFSLQKYRLRYVIGKLTQYVNEKAYGIGEADLSQFIKGNDIEHILPQNPDAKALASFDKPDQRAQYTGRLGNLTLLEASINRSVGNGSFDTKQKPYGESRYLLTKTIAHKVAVGEKTAIDRAAKDLITFDAWSSESIELRQEMLAELAGQVWEVQ